MSTEVAFVRYMCGSRRLPMVGRFERCGYGWRLVAGSRQRPGTAASLVVSENLGGSFDVDAWYAGCPRCGADSFAKCSVCYQLACWDTTREIFTCPLCDHSGPVSGTIEALERTD